METLEVARLLEFLDGVRLLPSRQDKRRWQLHPSGQFSCQSFRHHIQEMESGQVFPPYKQIWKAKTPTKVKMFVWQAALGRVNTADTMQRHRPYLSISPNWCVLCKKEGESVDHIFLHCSFSFHLWGLLLQEANSEWVTPRSCFDLFSIKLVAFGKGQKAKILWGVLLQAVLWNLWLERNRRIFEDYNGADVSEVWVRVKFWAALWASTTQSFKDIPYPVIMRNLMAAVR